MALAVSLAGAGCGAFDKKKDDAASGSKVGDDAEGNESDADDAPNEGEGAKVDDGDESSVELDPGAQSLDGTVTFSVDGEAKSFEYIPKNQAQVAGFGTSFKAKPNPSSKEEFALSLAQFDPRKTEAPVTVAFKPAELAKSGSPGKIAKSAKPILVYTSADGKPYKWFPTVHIESWTDGRLVGTLDEVTLEMPDDVGDGSVEISGAKFSVKLE